MDVFWFEKMKVIFRAALAIIKIRKHEILAVRDILNFKAESFEEALGILKDHTFFEDFDPDKFMKIAFKDFIFSTEDMNKLFDNYKKDSKYKKSH